jgi:hypothetical protein
LREILGSKTDDSFRSPVNASFSVIQNFSPVIPRGHCKLLKKCNGNEKRQKTGMKSTGKERNEKSIGKKKVGKRTEERKEDRNEKAG